MTTQFNLSIKFEYEQPEPENGITGGWVLTDIRDSRGNEIDLSFAAMDELTEKLTNQLNQ